MKKVMKFVKGKKEEETPVRTVPVEIKKVVNEKIDDTPREDDFISRDKTVTKLHKAVWNENSDKLKCIIKTHDIDITDKLDRTALYYAVLKNNPNIVNLLLENGANQNIPDIDGITPFLKSAQLGYKQCAANLLSHGADIKKTDKDINSCVHFAVMGKQSDMLTFLLEHNADCNTPNANEEFPLHIAIEMKDIEMIEILINNNCEINIVNNSGITPIMLAEQLAHLEILEILENYNIKVSKENNLFPDEISHKSSYENVNTPKTEQKFSPKQESDGDTWNESPVPSPRKNKPSTKITKFKNNEVELTEEKSESDVSVKCSENTSPQSGIIPPPCKPLRSLEYLQSGLTMENRPVHLLTLGKVRTRHISMTESDHSRNNTPHRYSYQGDFDAANGDSMQKLPDFSPADEKADISIKSKILSKLECDSTLQSDWGSNESLPLDEISIGGKKEKSVTSSTSKTTSNSGSIRDKSMDSFLQKQFSLLEDYEKNREKRCSVSYEMDLPTVKSDKNRNNSDSKLVDIDNLLEDNNRINTQLERYAGQTDTPVGITKSKSLPRNCEPYNYHKGSYSLPRTLESGKDPFREMKSHGYFKPRSHFSFSLKMLKGEKKSGFIDKLKSMFNKKAQIHLTAQSENGTWLYRKMDNEYYSSNLEGSFSGDDTFKRGDNLRTSKTLNNFSDLDNFEDDDSSRDPTFSNNEENKVIEKRILAVNMNREIKQSDSNYGKNSKDKNSSTEEDTKLKTKQKSLFSMVKNTGHKEHTDLGFCEDCSYIVALRLNEAEQNIINKDKFIQLLKEQLELLKDRNIKSINEAQDFYYKFSVASQELINLRHICTKYDGELKKLRTERSHLTEFEQIVATYKDEAERWKKQYEELITDKSKGEGASENFSIPSKTTADVEKWRSIIQDEVSTAVNMLKENSQVVITSLEKQNKKLETMTEKLQNELDTAATREEQLLKELLSVKNKLDDYKTQIAELIKDNKKYEVNMQILATSNETLTADFQRIDKLYSDLQKSYEENMKIFESDFKTSTEISEDFNIVKDEYRALTKSLSGLLEEIVKAKENALTKNEELRQQVAELGPSSNMKQFINQITLSLEKIGMPYEHKPEGLVDMSEPVIELSNSIADVEKINKLNTEIELQILEVKLGKKITSLQDENKKLKEDVLQKYDSLLTQIKESGEDIDEVSSELRSKKEIIQNQCYQICNLNDLIQEEKQRNEYLESELAHLKYEIQKEKTCNIQVSIENEELKSQLENSVKSGKSSGDENISMKLSLHEMEKINNDLNIQLEEAIITINEMEKKMIESQEGMQNLEKTNENLKKMVENLKTETIEEIRKEYENKIKTYVEDTTKLQNKLEKEKSNTNSLKKHIESLTFYFDNEKIANNARLIELQTENSSLKTNLQLEIEKLANMNMLQEEKIKTIEKENEQLRNNIEELTQEMNMLVDKLQNSDILQDPQKYVEALDCINKENFEMKSAMNVLRDILGMRFGMKDTKDEQQCELEELDSISIKSNSLPNLEFLAATDTKNLSITVGTPTSVKRSSSLHNITQKADQSKIEDPVQYIEKLQFEITSVLTKIDKNTHEQIPSVENSPEIYAEKYKEVIRNLQRQVKELKEEPFYKNEPNESTNLEGELNKLRKELFKQKIERIQETEIAQIKKEAEMLTLQQELKAQYLESKQKVEFDLARVQNALREKHEDEMRIKNKCDELVEEVTAHQETSQEKLQDICAIADQPLPPLPSNVQKIVICDVTETSQQSSAPQSSQYPEIPAKPNALVINARSKVNSREKNILTSESVPESTSEDEVKNKYLLK